MTGAEWFVAAMVLLQVGASAWYAAQSRWPDAVIWLGAAIANAAWIWKLVSER